jgi:hypothetical protein
MHYSSRNTYYYHTRQPNLSLLILKKYGKAISHDFSIELGEPRQQLVSEDDPTYLIAPQTLEEAVKQRDFYWKLYMHQLESYRKLEDELNTLKKTVKN